MYFQAYKGIRPADYFVFQLGGKLMGLTNKHSALSGDDNLGELVGEYPERDIKLKAELQELLDSNTEIDTSQ
jgi:hypothetical protein